MKLWVKTALALGIVGTTSGAVIGSIALFNKTSKKAKGVSYSVDSPLGNGYNIPSIRDLKLENLDTYFTKDIATKSSVFAKYDADKDEVTQNGKKLSFNDFNLSYTEEYNSTPVQIVRFGPALFQNEYLEAVSPKEFAEYVVWFLKNVSWGGDLAALENFSLRRGVKTEGSTIILGEHSNTNNEKTTIEFYPDAFFGSLPAYSTEAGAGQYGDKLLAKLTDEENNTLLTEDDIQELLNKKAEIMKIANIKDFRIRSIVPVQELTDPKDNTRNGKMGYEVYIDIYPDLIDDALARYPYLAKNLNGLHVEGDKLVKGNYKGINPAFRLPFLAVLAAANPEFKGVGINWLKYVGQHEYGHHITLQSLQDGSERGVYVGGVSGLKTLTPGQYYSLDVIKEYLAARATGITATATGTEENTPGELIRFVEGTDLEKDQEKNKDVYGSVFAVNIDEAIDNDSRRAGRLSLDDLATAAQARGVSLQDLIIENAWDINSGSLNPGSSGNALVYSIDKNGSVSLVPFNENKKNVIVDAKGNSIEKDDVTGNIIVQKWLADDGKTQVEPVRYKTEQDGSIVAIMPTNPNHQITNWDANTSKRETVIYKKTAGALVPVIPDDASFDEVNKTELEIYDFIAGFTSKYVVNGWESEGTIAKGFRIDSTVYNTANGYDFSEHHSSSEASYVNFLKNAKANLWRFVLRANSASNSTDPLIKDNKGNYFSPELTTTGQNVNKQLVTIGNYFSEIYLHGYSFGASTVDDSGVARTGLGSYFDVDGVKYTSMPSGNFGSWGTKGSTRYDTAWETLKNQQKTSTKKTNALFTFAQKSAPDNFLAAIRVDSSNGVVLGFKDKTGAAVPNTEFLPLDASIDPNNEISMFILDDAYNAAGSEIKTEFPNITFDATFLSQQLKDWKQGGSKAGQMTIAAYVKQLSLDPLIDFEFAKNSSQISTSSDYLDIKGKTIIKKTALEKFFDVTNFASTNNISEEEAQAILTEYVISNNLAFIKEFDSTQNSKTSLETNPSLKAYLLQGADRKSANKPLGFSIKAGIRQWFGNKEISDKDYQEIFDNIFAEKSKWNDEAAAFFDSWGPAETAKFDASRMGFNELALLLGIRRMNNPGQYQRDVAYKVIVGPSGDLTNYLQGRTETKLQNFFSDYTYNIAEMTNRDYIQITYTPGQEALENTPNWLGKISEASTGFEYAIDSTATSVYLEKQLANSSGGLESISKAIAKAFNFKFTDDTHKTVEQDDKSKPYVAPSKGIIAAANIGYNYYNEVSPSYLGKTLSMANGFFKDDYLRRSVGKEVFDLSGEWKYTIIGSEVYNSVLSTADPTTAIGKTYGNELESGAIIDAAEDIQSKWYIKKNQAIYEVYDDQQKKIGELDIKNLQAKPDQAIPIMDSTTLKGYFVRDALSLDNKKIQYKIINKKLYDFDKTADYLNVKSTDVKFQIQGNEIYNTDGSAVVDSTIKIKDIYKSPITDRATAVWEWLLESKGIGDGLEADPTTKVATKTGRNIEGIWRSPERDATYAWGYIPLQLQQSDGTIVNASDVKYLEYKDVSSGDTKYVPVWIGQNNLHYYQNRVNDPSSIHYLKDEGITSWTSDFIGMGGYQDAVLQTGHQYTMSLVDEDHKQLIKIDLGSRNVIAENGKPEGKAPNVIRNVNGEAIISVKDQFNN